MSYTVTVKEEISTIKSTKSELIAELSGYIRNNASFSLDKITMTTENKFTVDRITSTIKAIYNTNSKIEIVENLNFSKNDLYQITIENNIKIILSDLGIIDKDNNFLKTVPEYIVGANEEIRAYLRGVFSGTGSINDPKKSRYHLELLVTLPEEAVFVQKLLNLFDLNAKILNREKGYMIYIKEAEKISDFLKILRANKAVMYYEDVRVYRDQKNKTNRLNNCEQANINKVVGAASSQLRQIEIIKAHMALELLDDKTKEVVEYRQKYPEASLKELSEIISMETGKQLTKSGLNHRLRKIKELADKFEKP